MTHLTSNASRNTIKKCKHYKWSRIVLCVLLACCDILVSEISHCLVSILPITYSNVAELSTNNMHLSIPYPAISDGELVFFLQTPSPSSFPGELLHPQSSLLDRLCSHKQLSAPHQLLPVHAHKCAVMLQDEVGWCSSYGESSLPPVHQLAMQRRS